MTFTVQAVRSPTTVGAASTVSVTTYDTAVNANNIIDGATTSVALRNVTLAGASDLAPLDASQVLRIDTCTQEVSHIGPELDGYGKYMCLARGADASAAGAATARAAMKASTLA